MILVLAFVRLVTDAKPFPQPESAAGAWLQVGEWLDADPSWIPVPTDRHREVLDTLVPSITRSTLVPDAHLAALAVEHGLTLVSTDGDFARFPGCDGRTRSFSERVLRRRRSRRSGAIYRRGLTPLTVEVS